MLSHQKLKVYGKELIGLRRPWEKNVLREEPPAFESQPNSEPQGWHFAHEPLEVYQVGLKFAVKFNRVKCPNSSVPSELCTVATRSRR
jgi:hypothetical protein